MGWQLIESQSLQASAASVTFSSIPQTYKTLKLVVSARSAGSSNTIFIGFNGSGSNFTCRFLYGSGSAASGGSSNTNSIGDVSASGDTVNTFGNMEINIPNYAGSTNKPVSADSVSENNATAAWQDFWASLWSSTAAITSVTLTSPSSGANNFAFGSTFTLYGLT